MLYWKVANNIYIYSFFCAYTSSNFRFRIRIFFFNLFISYTLSLFGYPLPTSLCSNIIFYFSFKFYWIITSAFFK